MKFIIFATAVALLLLISQQSHAADTNNFINGVGQIPYGNGLWYLCSEEKTNSMSYALLVFKNTTKVDPDPNFGATLDGINKGEPIEPSVITFLVTDKNRQAMFKGTDYDFVESLSCYPDPVRQCEKNSGSTLLPLNKYCLVMMNPSNQPANFNITLSWSGSVFGNDNFTSPDAYASDNPNGGSAPDHNYTSANDSSSTANDGSSTANDGSSASGDGSAPRKEGASAAVTGSPMMWTAIALGLVAFAFSGM